MTDTEYRESLKRLEQLGYKQAMIDIMKLIEDAYYSNLTTTQAFDMISQRVKYEVNEK